jgi:hypothetical protein
MRGEKGGCTGNEIEIEMYWEERGALGSEILRMTKYFGKTGDN